MAEKITIAPIASDSLMAEPMMASYSTPEQNSVNLLIPEPYQIDFTSKEVEDLLIKIQNLEHELKESDNPISSKAVYDKFEELKSIVDYGKELIANAISVKGVNTSIKDTFEKMADNILDLPLTSGGDDLNITISRKTNYDTKYIANDGTIYDNYIDYIVSQMKKVILITFLNLEKEINEITAIEIEMEEVII